MQTITKEELKGKIDRGENLKLVDVRDTPDFRKEHIVGAVHLLIMPALQAARRFGFGVQGGFAFANRWSTEEKSGDYTVESGSSRNILESPR